MTQLAAPTSVPFNSCYWCLTFSNVLSPLTAPLNMRLRILSILILLIKMCLCYNTKQFVSVFMFFSVPFQDYKIVLKKNVFHRQNVVIETSQLENNSIHTVIHWVRCILLLRGVFTYEWIPLSFTDKFFFPFGTITPCMRTWKFYIISGNDLKPHQRLLRRCRPD